jgi:hypothetical protein
MHAGLAFAQLKIASMACRNRLHRRSMMTLPHAWQVAPGPSLIPLEPGKILRSEPRMSQNQSGLTKFYPGEAVTPARSSIARRTTLMTGGAKLTAV